MITDGGRARCRMRSTPTPRGRASAQAAVTGIPLTTGCTTAGVSAEARSGLSSVAKNAAVADTRHAASCAPTTAKTEGETDTSGSCPPVRQLISTHRSPAKICGRLCFDGSAKDDEARPGRHRYRWAFDTERVTRIELALSAWESAPFDLIHHLTSGASLPRVTVRHLDHRGQLIAR
jgi:hypothetical protein